MTSNNWFGYHNGGAATNQIQGGAAIIVPKLNLTSSPEHRIHGFTVSISLYKSCCPKWVRGQCNVIWRHYCRISYNCNVISRHITLQWLLNCWNMTSNDVTMTSNSRKVTSNVITLTSNSFWTVDLDSQIETGNPCIGI